MRKPTTEQLFKIGMWWRIIYGVLRILFGLVIMKLVGQPVITIVAKLMQHELIEDPHDMLYGLVTHTLANHPLYVSYFIATYFIFWGIVDIITSYSLLQHRRWAFPVSLVLISGFLFYEILRFSHTHSLILLGVICLDSIILLLIHTEYKKLRTGGRSFL